jgi:hypothetical protein
LKAIKSTSTKELEILAGRVGRARADQLNQQMLSRSKVSTERIGCDALDASEDGY